jgi:hypothetical protein
MWRSVIVPLGAGLIAFVLTMPMFCVGSSHRGREWCETFYRVRLPGSSIAGPLGTVIMYGVPTLIAVVAFLAVRAILARGSDPAGGDATSRS